jgi:small subunit ribosomal protein S19e
MKAYAIEPIKLIKKIADHLKNEMKKPEWADYVKSGANKERPPQDLDFYWIRAAAIMRKLYFESPIGVNKFRRIFGSRKKRGVKPEHKVKAGGKIIRTILQELEKLGYVEKIDKGRRLSAKGRKLIDDISKNAG